MSTPVAFDIVVLAGGTGERLGGVSKADLVLDGRRLLDHVLDATGGARRIVVVGEVAVPEGVLQTVEQPVRSGPAAGIVAGLQALADDAASRHEAPSPWVAVLATDAPGVAAIVPGLVHAASGLSDGSETDGIAPQDATGHPQWLAALYRREALAEAAAELGDPTDRPVKALVSGLRLQLLPLADERDARDIDTWGDHEAWQARLAGVATSDTGADTATPTRRSTVADLENPAWQEWADQVCADLGVDASRVDITAIHALTKTVAHGLERPLAPVSSFILGLALAADPTLTVAEGVRRIEAHVPGQGEA